VGNPSTQSESRYSKEPEKPVPGAVLIFIGNAPVLRPFPIAPGPVKFGKKEGPSVIALDDGTLSDTHAEVNFDGKQFSVRDEGTKNGSQVNGESFKSATKQAPSGAVMRLGYSVFLLLADIRPFLAATVSAEGYVIGPTLRKELDSVITAARSGARSLLITGENGSGKEYASRLFHQHAIKSGPYETFNSAGLEKGTAESTLFGHVKGAFTGANADKKGVAHSADGGVLFLDEIGEMDVELQAKLLRFIENQEVRRVGSESVEKVSVRFVAATNRDLEKAIAEGRFRKDLYYRLADTEVRLPTLNERPEDIPFLIDFVLREQPVRQAHATFVEAALLRDWAGNVRQLISVVKKAAQSAAAEKDTKIREKHLATNVALRSLTPSSGGGGGGGGGAAPAGGMGDAARLRAMSDDELKKVIDEHSGVISKTADTLKVSRNTLNRELTRRGFARAEGTPES
jgi:transcriptional regulator with GAF, ATPase, and Fis domain